FLLDYGRSASSDIQVSFWCYLSLACLFLAFNTARSRRWMAGAYLAAGMGMLSKGPVPLPVVGLPAAIYLLSLWLFPNWLGTTSPAGKQGAINDCRLPIANCQFPTPDSLLTRFLYLFK